MLFKIKVEVKKMVGKKSKVLLVGQGAREHAIAKALKRSDLDLYAFMKAKNPGIAKLSTKVKIAKLNDYIALEEFIKDIQPDIAVIGPENPLAEGIVDFLQEKGVESIGPTKTNARVEASKSFTRNLMKKYNIPGSIEFKVFQPDSKEQEIIDYINELGKVVVKRDGLAGGKGVKLMGEHLLGLAEVVAFCKEIFQQGEAVVLEELLVGVEFSLQCFVSGEDIVPTPIAQDHKRAYDGDQGPNCYSSDTEILTETGWNTFDKLDKNDKVMTFDQEKRILEFKKPEKVYWMKYEGEMVHFKHRELDLLVTPNHRMLVKNRKTEKIEVLEAGNLIGEKEIFLTGIWKGESLECFTIDEHDYKFNRKLEKHEIKFEDWIRFMGLYLSEGYVVSTEREKRVYICQTKKSKHFNDFEKILSKLPFNFSYREEDSKFRINSIQLVKILKEFGKAKEKFIPYYIKNAKREHIIEFLNAFALGDGSIRNGRIRFFSSSKKLIGDIQELILKIGKSSIISIDKRKKMLNPLNNKYYDASEVYSLEIKPETKVGIRKKDIKRVEYQGHIGCVTVSTGFVVVRRNNRVAISGNTGGMGSYSGENHLLPFIQAKIVEEAKEIIKKSAKAIKEETGQDYCGILYGGFMLTTKGLKLLEYNARFGDPEAMNVLPLLKTPLIDIFNAMIKKELAELEVEFEHKATVCKYLVPEGYPVSPKKGEPIDVAVKKILNEGADLFYSSVSELEAGKIITTSSRAIAIVGIADTIEQAEEIAEKATTFVKGPLFHRKDVGTKALIQKRIDHLKELNIL